MHIVTATAQPDGLVLIEFENGHTELVDSGDGSSEAVLYAQWCRAGNRANPYVPTNEQEQERLRQLVNEEKDRRKYGGFTFNGVEYQNDPSSLANINGAGSLAGFAMLNGAQAGDLYWHGGTEAFGFIASDNTVTPMDAQTTFAFAQAAAAHVTLVTFKAKALKDRPGGIPADFTDDSYWS
ncbi:MULTISPECIES: hypothetical protein [Halocynthiibacter]|uniref:DUF4376 domain-containing protein n=1 Tax=Halocynthiibacter halioticoli TaxID=2986804 RepID=A0AAE3J320_9RHOB|nr:MULTISPECIES: hypothetical protein [Halocynthiibacter]MCV6825995.1 hypothetical protein [Halocynthiibacter halioticoli]MCW4058996.1 hypothetical protein [Halocynthiibacter sp. SDUM655004]